MTATRQGDHTVRFDWGPTGGLAVGEGADVAVVVDVLSFTTALGVAVERGAVVVPYPAGRPDAAAVAAQTGAVLAGGRSSAAPDEPTLSPARLLEVDLPPRLVLPSPNGSAVAHALASAATTVVGASLRNAAAVASWIAREHDADDTVVAVVATGERWPDGTLRPAVEDLWGAGAVLAALEDFDWPGLSPEAALAADAYRLVRERESSHLHACASGLELVAVGWEADVAVAAQVGSSSVVPVLSDRGFVPAP
ncbi:2-phosphosulfolactate phosphatase [Aeromicrobium sp.]|uniref:2-phosphosulfolactate phosphatase n=1 Tax=Aeromicrobium sp. TaxID=1871063 RepID=UPI00351103DF